jgi:hypothetical protein
MLLEAFPGFVEVLEDYNNENTDKIDYRLGVTTPGITGTIHVSYEPPMSGGFQYSIACENGELSSSDSLEFPWVDGPGDTAQIVDDFTTLAAVGLGGTGVEMPLRSMQLALEKTAPGEPNEGFLREDALFVALILADEDDCSMPGDEWYLTETQNYETCLGPPPAEDLIDLAAFRDYLDGLFGDPSRYVVATVAGSDACSTASDAVRLRDFVENHVVNGVTADICVDDLTEALAEALTEMEITCDEWVPDIE